MQVRGTKFSSYVLFVGLLVAVLCALPGEAGAHRVNIMAWTEGKDVVTESAFSNGHKVRQGKVTVVDATTDAVILEGTTDTQGVFRFTPPESVRSHGLHIRINAGEGHQNSWTLDPADLSAPELPPGGTSSPTSAAEPSRATATSPARSLEPAPAASPGCVDAAQFQALLNTTLEAKLAPIRRELVALRSQEPGIREIVGGIGWIVGLAGLFLYARGRR